MEIFKDDVVKEVAEVTGESKKTVNTVISALFDTIVKNVADRNSIKFVGFGNFSSAVRAERVYRNPQTNEPVPVPEHRVPTFKAGKAFKDAVK